jgi:hypothetical protein
MAAPANGVEDKSVSATTTTIESPHHTGKRFRQFLRPNGRKVHIARTPEEQAQLKEELHPSEDFDVYLHGTEEHAGALLPP